MIADRQEIELPDPVAGPVRGMAAERDRLDLEGADLMGRSRLQGAIGSGLPIDLELVGGGPLGDQLWQRATGDDLRGTDPQRRDRIGKRCDPADVIPVRMVTSTWLTVAPSSEARPAIRATSPAAMRAPGSS